MVVLHSMLRRLLDGANHPRDNFRQMNLLKGKEKWVIVAFVQRIDGKLQVQLE